MNIPTVLIADIDESGDTGFIKPSQGQLSCRARLA